MDFDDLLLNTNILFRDFNDILVKYQNKFHYILVDEYQDTNYSQYLIVKKLSAVHRNVCAWVMMPRVFIPSEVPGLRIYLTLKMTIQI